MKNHFGILNNAKPFHQESILAAVACYPSKLIVENNHRKLEMEEILD
jgi:hypothetical protein